METAVWAHQASQLPMVCNEKSPTSPIWEGAENKPRDLETCAPFVFEVPKPDRHAVLIHAVGPGSDALSDRPPFNRAPSMIQHGNQHLTIPKCLNSSLWMMIIYPYLSIYIYIIYVHSYAEFWILSSHCDGDIFQAFTTLVQSMVRVFKLELLGWLWEVHGVRHSKINPILWFNVDLVRGNWHWRIHTYAYIVLQFHAYNYTIIHTIIACMYVCMYIIYIHTYIYTHIYIYIHTLNTHTYIIYIYTCKCVPMCMYIYLWCFLTLEYIPQVMVFNTKSWSSMTWMRGASPSKVSPSSKSGLIKMTSMCRHWNDA